MPLCLSCGICCDGSLFADVKLSARDVGQLPLSSMPEGALRGKARTLKMSQPCFALNRLECSIYRDRPGHCRKFDCDLLARFAAGQVTQERALEIIATCRAKADEVRQFLKTAGNHDEAASLNARFRSVSRLAAGRKLAREESWAFADLTVAMHELHSLLCKHIYPV